MPNRRLAAARSVLAGGTGRPVTRNLRPLRPSIGKARQTRSATGASSRLVSPRWLSISASTSGTRRSAAARPIGPGDVAAAPEHRAGRQTAHECVRRRGRRRRRSRPPGRPRSGRRPRGSGASRRGMELVAGLRDERRLGALAADELRPRRPQLAARRRPPAPVRRALPCRPRRSESAASSSPVGGRARAAAVVDRAQLSGRRSRDAEQQSDSDQHDAEGSSARRR